MILCEVPPESYLVVHFRNPPSPMRKIFLLILVFMPLVLQSCRCADPPPVGPVEERAR